MTLRHQLLKRIAIVITCGAMSACTTTELKEAGAAVGKNTLEQLFILSVGGMDGLEAYNDKKREEWERETNPYRSSYSVNEFLALEAELEKQREYDRMRRQESSGETLESPGTRADQFVLDEETLDQLLDPLP